ncbi:MAG: hypothetical protein HFE77_05785 [Clostridiales bacterium]|nr:hypothetical protein [Clostridiales bacterium]
MKISVTKYGLTPDTADGGTKGSYGIETLSFSFSPEWDTLAKSITFYPPHSTPICVYLEKDEIPLPYEVTERAGKTSFVICGTNQKRTILTVTGTIEVRDTINPTEREAGDYTPSAIAVITQACEDAKANADRAKQAVDDILSRGSLLTTQYVDTLPDEGEMNVLYIVPSESETHLNKKSEYLYVVLKPTRYAWQRMGEAAAPTVIFTEQLTPDANAPIYNVQGTAVAALTFVSCTENKLVVKNTVSKEQYTYQRAAQADLVAEYGWEKVGTEDDLQHFEQKMNKTTNLSASSTDEQYPSAKTVYNALEEKASLQLVSSVINNKVSNYVVYEAVNSAAGEVIVSDGNDKLIGSGTNIATLNQYGVTKLDKPKAEGNKGQYLVSDGDGGSTWKTFDHSYSKAESDARYAAKGEAGGTAGSDFSVITGTDFPEEGETNKLYLKKVTGAEDYGYSYEKSLYVPKSVRETDDYIMWQNEGGPAYVYTTESTPKAGDMAYYGNEWPNPTALSPYCRVASVSADGTTLALTCGDTSTNPIPRTLTLTNYGDIPTMGYERIGEKPWQVLLDYTADASDPQSHLYVNKDREGKSFSISEIEMYFKLIYPSTESTPYADQFILTGNTDEPQYSLKRMFEYRFKEKKTCYGSLRMNRNPILNGWSGIAEYGTDMSACIGYTETKAAHTFSSLEDLYRFNIFGRNSGTSTTNQPFYTGTRFVVRGR